MLYGLFQDAPDSLYSNPQGNIFLQDEVDRPLVYQVNCFVQFIVASNIMCTIGR